MPGIRPYQVWESGGSLILGQCVLNKDFEECESVGFVPFEQQGYQSDVSKHCLCKHGAVLGGYWG